MYVVVLTVVKVQVSHSFSEVKVDCEGKWKIFLFLGFEFSRFSTLRINTHLFHINCHCTTKPTQFKGFTSQIIIIHSGEHSRNCLKYLKPPSHHLCTSYFRLLRNRCIVKNIFCYTYLKVVQPQSLLRLLSGTFTPKYNSQLIYVYAVQFVWSKV